MSISKGLLTAATSRPCVVKSPSRDLGVLAGRSADGLTVAVSNRSAAKLSFKLSTMLEPGAYWIERIAYPEASAGAGPRQTRLAHVIVRSSSAVVKPAWLNAGEVGFYRFRNARAELLAAHRSVRQVVARVGQQSAAEHRRFSVPLGEAGFHIGVACADKWPSDTERSVKHLQRSLLAVAHAQALCRNAAGLKRVSSRTAGLLTQSLDVLEQCLAEYSTLCLGLIPAIEWSQPTGSNHWRARLSLRNTGSQLVANVQLGLSAPVGATVSPAERAACGALGPGQSASAEFKVVGLGPGASVLYTAGYSFLAARVPARLRLNSIPQD